MNRLPTLLLCYLLVDTLSLVCCCCCDFFSLFIGFSFLSFSECSHEMFANFLCLLSFILFGQCKLIHIKLVDFICWFTNNPGSIDDMLLKGLNHWYHNLFGRANSLKMTLTFFYTVQFTSVHCIVTRALAHKVHKESEFRRTSQRSVWKEKK